MKNKNDLNLKQLKNWTILKLELDKKEELKL